MTTTSLAQVTIVNTYSINANPVTPSVHLARGAANSSSFKVAIDRTGSHAYINMTEYFQLSGQNYVNLTNIIHLVSTTSSNFGYVSNVTLFNGQKTTEAVDLYSIASNGSYSSDYNFTASSSYSANTGPIYISQNGNSSFGLYIQLGKSGYTGPYTWNLNFKINGFYSDNGNIPQIYTQYFVDIKVTTFEVA